MKTFYIFSITSAAVHAHPDETRFEFEETFSGTVQEARELLKGENYEAGRYLVLEDTSGFITKNVTRETVTKSDLVFSLPEARKRPRKAKEA